MSKKSRNQNVNDMIKRVEVIFDGKFSVSIAREQMNDGGPDVKWIYFDKVGELYEEKDPHSAEELPSLKDLNKLIESVSTKKKLSVKEFRSAVHEELGPNYASDLLASIALNCIERGTDPKEILDLLREIAKESPSSLL